MLDKQNLLWYNISRSRECEQYAGVAQWQSSWFVISRLMVRLRSPAPFGWGCAGNRNMGDFPSGQRGQTVNLLSLTSVVRIHHPPPKNPIGLCLSGFLLTDSAFVTTSYLRSAQIGYCLRQEEQYCKMNFAQICGHESTSVDLKNIVR